MKTNTKKGFTLIELLVVIAIIGILSSVVLASLNSARNKGADAAVKANLVNARAEAELFADNNSTQSYDSVCALTGTNVIGDNVAAAASAGGATYSVSDAANLSTSVAVCHDSATGWVAASPMKGTTTVAFCVDSTGEATSVALSALDTDADVTCN